MSKKTLSEHLNAPGTEITLTQKRVEEANTDTKVAEIILINALSCEREYETPCKGDCGKMLQIGEMAIKDEYKGVYCSEQCRRSFLVELWNRKKKEYS